MAADKENSNEKHENLHLGVLSFAGIASAFDSSESVGQQSYDIVKNNCATVVVDMMAGLGIDTREVVEFTSQQLLMNDKTIHTLRSSPNLKDMLRQSGIDSDVSGRLELRTALVGPLGEVE